MMSAFALIDEANSALAQNSTYAVYASGLVLTLAMLAFCVDLAQTPGRKERTGEAAAHTGDEDAAEGASTTSSGEKSAGGATAVLERTETEATTQVQEPGDHERFSHYVRKEKILESALSGEPVTALCGKIWVPGRDPKKFPVCPICQEIYDGLRPPEDGGDE